MIIYIVTVIIVVLTEPFLTLFLPKRKVKKAYILCVGMWMFLVLSLRSETVGNDLDNYLPRYILFGNTPWIRLPDTANKKATEIGYAVINKLLFYLNASPRTLLVFAAFIMIWLLCLRIYTDSPIPRLSFIIYIGLSLYTSAFSGLRQSIATAVFMYAYKYLKNRDFVKYCMVIVLASTIHKSILVVIPLYFLVDIKIDMKKSLCFLAAFGMCWLLGEKIISFIASNFKYENYVTDLGSGGGAVGLLVIYLSFLASIFLLQKNYNAIESRIYIYSLFILTLFTILTFSLSITTRIMSYFNALIVITLPTCIARTKNTGNRKIMSCVYSVMLLAYYFLTICRADTSGIIPYEFMWN